MVAPSGSSARGFLWPQAFTDDGPYVDRFGLLLVVTATSIVGLALFDITDPEERVRRRGARVAGRASIIVGRHPAHRAARLAAFGERQRFIDILVGIGLAGLTLVTAIALLTEGTGRRQPQRDPPAPSRCCRSPFRSSSCSASCATSG